MPIQLPDEIKSQPAATTVSPYLRAPGQKEGANNAIGLNGDLWQIGVDGNGRFRICHCRTILFAS
jgi:hypothetical protein